MFLLPFYDPDGPSPLHAKDGWKFFIVCKDKDGEQSDFIDAMEGMDPSLQESFVLMMRQLTKLAASGKPWKSILPDAKRMHDVGKIKIKHADGSCRPETVWEFKHGKLRILWCYGGQGRVMLFGHVLFKDQNKIDPSDLDIVEDVMTDYAKAYETGQIRIVGGEENERTFGKLFPESEEGCVVRKKDAPRRHRR